MMESTISKSAGERPKAIIFLIITAILWSLGGLLIKLVNTNPLAIAGVRSAIAAVVLLIFLKKPKITWSFPQVAAALAYVGTVILFVAANKMTTAANAILLQYTAPIYVAILGTWMLKEKTKVMDWITVLIVIGGMLLFFVDKINANGMAGNILAIASGVSFALFAIFMRMQKDGSPLESVFLGNIFTAIIGVPFLFKGMPNTTGWVSLIVLGIVQLGIPYIFYAKAIKHATALDAVLVPVLEPILNPIWVFLILKEIPSPLALIGGAIVLIAITVRCVLPVLRNNDLNIETESSISEI